MPVYAYTCFDVSGKEVKGIINADTARSAREELRKQRLFPYEIKEEKRSGKAGSLFSLFLPKIRPAAIAAMTRQLATLIDAGIPLVDALQAVADQEENLHLKKMLSQIRDQVREGKPLSEALSPFADTFSRLYINMVAIGEESGTLGIVTNRLADHLEENIEMKSKVNMALSYPLFMSVVGASVIAFLTMYVIPKVTEIFQNYHQSLPLPTRLLLFTSSFLASYWYAVIFLILALFTFGVMIARTDKGKEFSDRFLLKLPIVGDLLRMIAVAHFTRTLSVLLVAGVPLLKAMEIVSKTIENSVYQKIILQCRASLRDGHGIAEQLKKSGAFPVVVVQMVAAGEKSGTLSQMLLKLADTYDKQIEASLTKMTTLLEPIIILLMGLCVAFIVISILLPILEMSQLVKS